ncbi:MAG: sigma-54-dependent transcriptional regulator [Candidatus Anammoxibacter sp.]
MKKHSILVVDDEEIILKTLELDLKDAGYNVNAAGCGEDAKKRLNEDDYDLVITDLMMSGIDGIQILKDAKKKNPETKVIILTGYGSLTSAVDALRLGASDYVLKPYNKDEILMRIASSLEKLELQRRIKIYEDILPMCSVCKKIRDDAGTDPGKGVWIDADTYLKKITNVDISHGCCDECAKTKKQDIYLQKQKDLQAVKQLAK